MSSQLLQLSSKQKQTVAIQQHPFPENLLGVKPAGLPKDPEGGLGGARLNFQYQVLGDASYQTPPTQQPPIQLPVAPSSNTKPTREKKVLPIKKSTKLANESRQEPVVTSVAATTINEQMTKRKTGPVTASLDVSVASNYARKMAMHYQQVSQNLKVVDHDYHDPIMKNSQGHLILLASGEQAKAETDSQRKIVSGDLQNNLAMNNNPKVVPTQSSIGQPINRMPRQNKSAPSQNNIGSQGGQCQIRKSGAAPIAVQSTIEEPSSISTNLEKPNFYGNTSEAANVDNCQKYLLLPKDQNNSRKYQPSLFQQSQYNTLAGGMSAHFLPQKIPIVGSLEQSQEMGQNQISVNKHLEESCENIGSSLIISNQISQASRGQQAKNADAEAMIAAGLSSKDSQRSKRRRHNILQCEQMVASYNESSSVYQTAATIVPAAKKSLQSSGQTNRWQSNDGNLPEQKKFSTNNPIGSLPPIASPQKLPCTNQNNSVITDRGESRRTSKGLQPGFLPQVANSTRGSEKNPHISHSLQSDRQRSNALGYRKKSNHTQLITKTKSNLFDVGAIKGQSINRRSEALLNGTTESGLSNGQMERKRQVQSVKRTQYDKFDQARQSYYACQCCRIGEINFCPDHLPGPATITQYRQARNKPKVKTQTIMREAILMSEQIPTKIIKSAQICGSSNTQHNPAAAPNAGHQLKHDQEKFVQQCFIGFGDSQGIGPAAMLRTQLPKVHQQFTPQKRKIMRKTISNANARGGFQNRPGRTQKVIPVHTFPEEETKKGNNLKVKRKQVQNTVISDEKSSLLVVDSPTAVNQGLSPNSASKTSSKADLGAHSSQIQNQNEQFYDEVPQSPADKFSGGQNPSHIYIEQNLSVQQSKEKETLAKMRIEREERLIELEHKRKQQSPYQSPTKSLVQGQSMMVIEQQISPRSSGHANNADRISQLSTVNIQPQHQTEVKKGHDTSNESAIETSSSQILRHNIIQRLDVPANSLVKAPFQGGASFYKNSSPMLDRNQKQSSGNENCPKLSFDLIECQKNEDISLRINESDLLKDQEGLQQAQDPETKVQNIQLHPQRTMPSPRPEFSQQTVVYRGGSEEIQTTPKNNKSGLAILQNAKMNSSQAQFVDRSPEIVVGNEISNLTRQQSQAEVQLNNLPGVKKALSFRFKNYNRGVTVEQKREGDGAGYSSNEEDIRSECTNSIYENTTSNNLGINSHDNITNQDRKGSLRDTNSVKVNQRKQQLQEVKRGLKLGEGSFGVVFQGLYDGAQSQYSGSYGSDEIPLPPQMAIKVMHIEDKRLLSKLEAEYELMSTLKHKNIIQCYGCLINEEGTEASIFMELMPNSLQTQYRGFGPLHERVIQRHAKQILEALCYLHNHELRIIHGDLKAANILSDAGQIKLTDFGDSRRLEQVHHDESGAIFNDFKGSILWMAPEVLQQKRVGRRSDIWSLGCTLIELATAQHPWNGIKDVYQLIEKLEKHETPEIPENLSATAKDFIKSCLIFEKEQRPSALELLQHAFVNDGLTINLQPSQQASQIRPQ